MIRKWVKIWIRNLDNPRYGLLSDSAYRRIHEMMRVAGENETLNGELIDHNGKAMTTDYLAFVLRVKEDQLLKDLNELKEEGHIRVDSGIIKLINFKNDQRSGERRVAIPVSVRCDVVERDNGTCRYCGDPYEHLDHIIPYSRGGSNSLENLVCACARCNWRKSNMTPDEARMKLIPLSEA